MKSMIHSIPPFILLFAFFLLPFASKTQIPDFLVSHNIWAVGLNVGFAERAAFSDENPVYIIEYLESAIVFADQLDCISSDGLRVLRNSIQASSSGRAYYNAILNFRLNMATIVANNCFCSDGVPSSMGTAKPPMNISCQNSAPIEWSLASNGSPRIQRFRFDVSSSNKILKIRIQDGYDDTGDHKVNVVVLDPGGNPILNKNSGSSSNKWDEWQIELTSFGIHEMQMIDNDSQDSGQYPGNGGKLQIVCGDFVDAISCNRRILQNWALGNSGNPRETVIPFRVSGSASSIKIRIQGGDDNTGDGAVHLILKDEAGRLRLEKNSNSSDSEWHQWIVSTDGQSLFYLYLQEFDTKSDGRYPGNGGKLEIECGDFVDALSCSVKISKKWGLGAGNSRETMIPFRLDPSAAYIKIRIQGGHDNTGDGAVHLILKDEAGRLRLEKNSNSSDSEWHQWIVGAGGQSLFYLYLQDFDTKSDGRYPGNGGRLEIQCY